MKHQIPVARTCIILPLLIGYLVAMPGKAATFGVTPNDHVMGAPTAPVTVIEYGAPSCPACARFNAQVVLRLKKTYIDKGEVRYVFRVWPLRPSDAAAEKIARCLPGSKYFLFLDALFRDRRSWDAELGARDPQMGLTELGRRFGLSPGRINHCIGDTAQDANINRAVAHGEAKYHITGTPTIIVDGAAQPPGSLSWNKMNELIEAALAGKQGKTARP